MRSIAFFDFDGTITTRDTLLEFIKFSKGKSRFYLGFALNSPWLLAYKFKLIPNYRAKEKILGWFFRGTTPEAFQVQCDRFAAAAIPALLRPGALDEIAELKAKGFQVVVVSASPENWLRPWTSTMELDLIGTRLATSSGKLTGKIAGNNCYGEEKVRRIRDTYTLEDYTTIHAYGDSSGDKPMLAAAHIRFYKPFR